MVSNAGRSSGLTKGHNKMAKTEDSSYPRQAPPAFSLAGDQDRLLFARPGKRLARWTRPLLAALLVAGVLAAAWPY